ncbi:unnamed protein product [Ixodes pacificus]
MARGHECPQRHDCVCDRLSEVGLRTRGVAGRNCHRQRPPVHLQGIYRIPEDSGYSSSQGIPVPSSSEWTGGTLQPRPEVHHSVGCRPATQPPRSSHGILGSVPCHSSCCDRRDSCILASRQEPSQSSSSFGASSPRPTSSKVHNPRKTSTDNQEIPRTNEDVLRQTTCCQTSYIHSWTNRQGQQASSQRKVTDEVCFSSEDSRPSGSSYISAGRWIHLACVQVNAHNSSTFINQNILVPGRFVPPGPPLFSCSSVCSPAGSPRAACSCSWSGQPGHHQSRP